MKIRLLFVLFLESFLPSCKLPNPTNSGANGETVRRAELQALPVELDVTMTDLNDAARYMAGLPGGAGSPFTAARQTPHWQLFQTNMDELWRQFSSYRQPRISAFAEDALGSSRRQSTLFYPFSGPDILFAQAFFPECENYILVGLEGPQLMPDLAALSAEEREGGLDGIYTSITTALNCSFFITKDMRRDLQSTRLQGTLPIVLTFLARLGADIQEVSAVSLDAAGNLQNGTAGAPCPGYVVRCRQGWGRNANIYYFQENLADGSLNKDPRLLSFVGRFGSTATYLKSASYLMHSGGFNTIRSGILKNSHLVVQDDSGIPVRSFASAGWDVQYFGNYAGVLDIFTEYHQPEIARAIELQGRRDIDFGLGYMFEKGQSCVMVAKPDR